MNLPASKTWFLRGFIGFLGITACLAILSVLSGEFGEFEAKVIGTSLTISVASICSMSCAAFIQKTGWAGLGLAGILVSALAGLFIILGMWVEMDSELYWKTAGTLGVAAFASAHAFLLSLPALPDRQRWVQGLASMSIGVLALAITVAMWKEIQEEGYFRFLAVLSILVGLVTLVIPVLMRLRKTGGSVPTGLALKHLDGDRYCDAAGAAYRVIRLDPETPTPDEADLSTPDSPPR